MIRKHWTARMLARHVIPGGWVGRPVLGFRIRQGQLPELPPSTYSYRHYHLAEFWSEDLVELFARLDPVPAIGPPFPLPEPAVAFQVIHREIDRLDRRHGGLGDATIPSQLLLHLPAAA